MAIEVINPIKVTPAQEKAIRKMAARDSKHSANEFASILMGRVITNTFKPLVKSISADAKKRFELAIAGGFPAPSYKVKGEDGKEKDVVLTAEEYAKRAAEEYKLILADLEA